MIHCFLGMQGNQSKYVCSAFPGMQRSNCVVVIRLLTSLLCGCAGELRCSLLFQVKESPMCVFTSCFHTATLMLSWMVMNRKESFCVVWCVGGCDRITEYIHIHIYMCVYIRI